MKNARNMRKSSLTILLVLFCFGIRAQELPVAEQERLADSIRKAAAEQAALLYPRIRQFSITHEENGVGKIRSKVNGNNVFEGNFRSSRTRINMNMPVLQRRNNTLVASLGVIHQFYELSDITNFDSNNPVYDHSTYMPMLSTAITYIRTDSLFGKPVTITASAGSIFNPSMSRSQFTFTGIVTVPFIRTENTRLSGGAAILLDPASPVPFFLMINYYHKFRKWDMDLTVDLPSRIALRKELTPKASLTFFNELAGNNSFFEFDKAVSLLPTDKLTLSSLEIKSGLMAEYRLTKKVIISMSGGVNNMVNSRIRENNSKPKDYFIDNKHKPVPFVQVGLSILPFWKGLDL